MKLISDTDLIKIEKIINTKRTYLDSAMYAGNIMSNGLDAIFHIIDHSESIKVTTK